MAEKKAIDKARRQVKGLLLGLGLEEREAIELFTRRWVEDAAYCIVGRVSVLGDGVGGGLKGRCDAMAS